MNTGELVAHLAEKSDLSKAETRRLLDTVVQTLTDTLGEGKPFTIPELGSFKIHKREKRRSYNPHYKQYMMLPPKQVVDFHPSENLKEKIK